MPVTDGRVNTNQISHSTFYVKWWQISQDTATNTTKIGWAAGLNTGSSSSHDNFYNNAVKINSVVINGQTVSAGGTWSRILTGGDHDLVSGELDIPHNADGTKTFSASISGWTYSNSNYSGSNSFELTSIARYATLDSVADFDDEHNPTINYTNNAGNNVTTLRACISLDGTTTDPVVPFRDIPKTGNSYTFELTSTERNALRNATTGKNLLLSFIIETVLGGDTFYSTGACRMYIVNGNPYVELVTYSDTNSDVTDVTHDDQKIVQGLSYLQFQFYDVEALKGASLATLTIDINGTVTTVPFTGTAIATATYNYGEVDVSENVTASVTITDSRGFSTTKQVPLTILEYDIPSAIITVGRVANFYSNSNIKVDANYSSLGGLNTIAIKYRIKKVEDNWDPDGLDWVVIQDNVETSFTADNQYAWDLQVYLEDIFGTHYQYTINKALDVGIPIVFYDVLMRSVGINCLPTHDGELEYRGQTLLDYAHPIGSILKTDSNVNPSTYLGGTWVQIPCRDLIEEGTFDDGTSYASGKYRIYANGDFEIWGTCGYFNLAAQNAKTFNLSFPYTMTNCYCNVSFLWGGQNYANCNSYCYASGSSVNTYTWNNGAVQATDLALTFHGNGTLDLAANNIDTIYEFKRVS